MKTITRLAVQWLAAMFLALMVLPVAVAAGQEQQEKREAEDLTNLDLATLMNMDVTITSVSKKAERLFNAPAAVYSLSNEDIRRSGATTLPEALRLVPGMNVARIDSHNYALSARGFMGQFADKLLVMIDGRTIYEPTFAGVHWATQDLMLEDLERIEVIRGPGATLWGANAVNGVVNIITKSARETHGALISTSIGTEDRPSGGARYGGQAGANLHYRVYVKRFDREGLKTSTGQDAPDDWQAIRTGFRADWESTASDFWTLEADYFDGKTSERVTEPLLTAPFTRSIDFTGDNAGGHVLGRWTRTFSARSQLSIQTYYTHAQFYSGDNRTTSDIFDFELQDQLALGNRNDLIWGVGYRSIADEISPTDRLMFDPQSDSASLYTAFVQDDITLVPGLLRLSVGSKFEHNDQTGFELQPGARLHWTPTQRQAVWASASRAVRTPARFETGARKNVAAFPRGPLAPAQIALVGSPDLEAEELIAYELGYRIEATRRLSFDMASFYNVYENLIDYLPGTPRLETAPPPPHLLMPRIATNLSGGNSYGAEIAVQWGVTERWQLAADYSWLHLRFLDGSIEFDSPEQLAHLRSYLALPWGLEINGSMAYVDRLGTKNIPSYVRLDLGLSWHPSKSLEVSLWGQNLLDDRHPEFTSLNTSLLTEVRQTVTGRIVWNF